MRAVGKKSENSIRMRQLHVNRQPGESNCLAMETASLCLAAFPKCSGGMFYYRWVPQWVENGVGSGVESGAEWVVLVVEER